MAKKPPATSAKSSGNLTPTVLAGTHLGGESPQKAYAIPADALISFSYEEEQRDGGTAVCSEGRGPTTAPPGQPAEGARLDVGAKG